MVEQAKMLTGTELITLSGAITSVLVVSQGIRAVFGLAPKYIGLLISFALAYYAMWSTSSHALGDWLAATVNAFIIFSGATGAASIGAAAASTGGSKSHKAERGQHHLEETADMSTAKFWGAWFKDN